MESTVWQIWISCGNQWRLAHFKGILPAPSVIGTQFKFVRANLENQKIEYEGDSKSENRKDELLPDSLNFFIFKPKPESVSKKFLDFFKFLGKTNVKEEIACEFFNILFNHTLKNILPGIIYISLNYTVIGTIILYFYVQIDWDDAFEVLDDGLQKMRQAV